MLEIILGYWYVFAKNATKLAANAGKALKEQKGAPILFIIAGIIVIWLCWMLVQKCGGIVVMASAMFWAGLISLVLGVAIAGSVFGFHAIWQGFWLLIVKPTQNAEPEPA